ncbi:MAG: hypothetical protein OSA84_10880 [Akkermansiaceae bacterium]|nr:hypothetical protein [Akkermansiaceae bacterium]
MPRTPVLFVLVYTGAAVVTIWITRIAMRALSGKLVPEKAEIERSDGKAK